MSIIGRDAAAHGWTEGDIDVDGVLAHYYRTGGPGAKPPVVLAHGFSDNGLCWSRVAAALADDFDVVMVDSRNHGKSATARGGVSDLANDIARVIDQLGLARPVLMGHSLGASTMAVVAARHPQLAFRLLLEDPPWMADQAEDTEAAQRRRTGLRAYLSSLANMTEAEIVELGRREHPDWPRQERPAWIVSKQQVRLEAADSLSMVDWVALVPRIACPTLLLHGEPERGGIVTPDVAQRVVSLNDLVTSRAIDHAGHNIRRENFDSYVEAVRTFLEGA